jgi:hypothetical protein
MFGKETAVQQQEVARSSALLSPVTDNSTRKKNPDYDIIVSFDSLQ